MAVAVVAGIESFALGLFLAIWAGMVLLVILPSVLRSPLTIEIDSTGHILFRSLIGIRRFDLADLDCVRPTCLRPYFIRFAFGSGRVYVLNSIEEEEAFWSVLSPYVAAMEREP